MNRRSFLDSILKAGAGAAILPAARTYARHWPRHVPRGTADGEIFVEHQQLTSGVPTITARYKFGAQGQISVLVTSGGKEYGSLMEAARAIARERAVTKLAVERPKAQVEQGLVGMGIDVCVVYDSEGSVHVRQGTFKNMPVEFIAENSKFTEPPLVERLVDHV